MVTKDKGRIILAGPNFKHWASENVIPKLKELIPWEVCIDRVESQGTDITKLHFYTGWTLKILSYEQDDGVYESWTCDLMAFDEAPPYSKWGGAMRGCLKNSAPVIIAYTPWGEHTPWTHDALFLKAAQVQKREDLALVEGREIVCVKAIMEDNPYLTDKQRDWYREELRERPEEYEARVNGNYSTLMGRVYSAFDVAKHVQPLEKFF